MADEKTASDWSMEMVRLREVRPRPLAKLFGAKGPTLEQLAAYKEFEREWNRAYRHATKMQKETLAAQNAAYLKDRS